ncbi:MAG: hypothetical protein HYR87_10075 [Thaumarchaeota archaeon]|nr:hypothetical protein [Nitrososphaerota archaeon]
MEDIVRPELNLEKWPGMWQPAKSSSKMNEIILERKRSDGLISKIEITANSKYGAMTTETQKVMYALYKISEENGHPRRISFSRRKIAKKLGRQWGRGIAETINDALYQLRSTFFVLKDAFYDASSKKLVSVIKTFTILSDLGMTDEEIDGHVTKEACYCEFNEYIYNNLVHNYVKPLLLETFLEFGDDGIAQLLYSHFDLMLSKSDEYRRPTKEIFCGELKSLGEEYKYVSRRKRAIERIKPKLDGKRLSSGGVLKISLEKSLKGNDYDLVAKKIEKKETKPFSYDNETVEEYRNITQADRKRIEKLAKSIPETKKEKNLVDKHLESEGAARELVQHFHKRLFHLENVKVSPKELHQAKELIKEYGFNVSKYIIDYANNQATETNYKIGQFGAILEYAGRGAAQYEKDIKRTQHIEKLEGCQFCNGLIYVDVVMTENGKEYLKKFKCPHNLETLETIAKEKKVKFILRNGNIIDF